MNLKYNIFGLSDMIQARKIEESNWREWDSKLRPLKIYYTLPYPPHSLPRHPPHPTHYNPSHPNPTHPILPYPTHPIPPQPHPTTTSTLPLSYPYPTSTLPYQPYPTPPHQPNPHHTTPTHHPTYTHPFSPHHTCQLETKDKILSLD